MAEAAFTLEMTVAEALKAHPGAAKVLAGYGLGGCALCHAAHVESIRELCETYGIDQGQLLTQLGDLVAAPSA